VVSGNKKGFPVNKISKTKETNICVTGEADVSPTEIVARMEMKTEILSADEKTQAEKDQSSKFINGLKRARKGDNNFRIMNVIDPRMLSSKVRELVGSTGKGYVGRNSKCPCGSQKRFKRCCMTKE